MNKTNKKHTKYTKHKKSTRGAAPACCIIVLLIGVLTVIGVIASYFLIWNLPDKSRELTYIHARLETDINSFHNLPPDRNAWTYYKEALDTLDLSTLAPGKPKADTDESPETQLSIHNLAQLADTIENLTLDPQSKNNLELIRALAEKNQKVLSLIETGFQQNKCLPDPTFRLESEKFEDAWKIHLLTAYLIKLGDLEKTKGRNTEAAKLYLEAYHLKTVMTWNSCGGGILYRENQSSLFPLLELIRSSKNNRQLLLYIAEQLDRIPTQPFINKIETIYAALEEEITSAQNHKTLSPKDPPRSTTLFLQQAPDFLLKREKNVLQNITLTYLNHYAKNPHTPINTIPLDNKLKFSIMGQVYQRILLEEQKQIHYHTACLEGARLTAALQLYNYDTGNYPETLEELTPSYLPEIPQDPYAKNQSFIYKNQKGTPLLYSVGPDGADNAGTASTSKSRDSGDILFLYPENPEKK